MVHLARSRLVVLSRLVCEQQDSCSSRRERPGRVAARPIHRTRCSAANLLSSSPLPHSSRVPNQNTIQHPSKGVPREDLRKRKLAQRGGRRPLAFRKDLADLRPPLHRWFHTATGTSR